MDIVKTGSTWMLCTAPILDVNGARLTGLTDIAFSVRRYTSGAWQWLDFADSTFKASPGTLRAVMTAVDATRAAGVYAYALNTSAITNVTFGDQLFIDIQQTSLTNAANANQAGGGVYGEVVDKVEANLTVATSTLATSTALATAQGNITSILAFGAPPTAAAVSAQVVDQALSGHTTAGTVGEALSRCDVATSTRLATSSYSAAPSAATVAAAVVDQALSGHTTAGTAGAALSRVDVATSTLATSAALGTAQNDITTIKNYGAPPSAATVADAVRAGIISDHGAGDYRTPATVTLADASLTAAKVGAGFVDLAQNGLASRATMVFDAEIGESPVGEAVYFPYFKNGTAVIGATVTMMVSRLGLADPGPGYEFQTLDFSAEIFVPPADNTDPLITMSPVDASTPGVYTAYAYVSGFATNSVKPDVYTVWFFDGAELVGMGRLRAGTTDIVAALPADITSARDHVETAVAGGFTEIKGAGWTAGQDDLKAIRARGDTAWVTANLTGIATSANVTDAVTATLAGIVSAHGAGSYVTASVAGLAMSSDVATAVAAIEAYGQAHWQTATTVSLNDGALLPVKIGAGFVNAMQANLALEASLTAMKGASFDTNTDSLRATRVLVSALPTAGAPSAATIRDAVWAAADDAPTAGTRGWELWRLAQWGTETNPKKIVGNELRLYTPGLGSVLAAVTLHDAAGNDIAPGTGEPAQYLP